LAPALKENAAELYMLGMLSMMDRMLHVPMTKLLGVIYLSSKIEEALLGSKEGLGKALEICEYHERGGDGKGPPHSDPLVRESAANYFDALVSAGKTMHALIS
jgi:c-di-GMP-related signal transduction protein